MQILQLAVRKTFEEPEYPKERKKAHRRKLDTADAEAFEKIVRELPREPETIDLFKKLSGAYPLPPR